MATIKQIDRRSIHQIQSGQVIVDLCSVVKELVENSVDAGATVIDVRFKNQGLDLIEIQDNGSGISPANYPSVALKHHTSKLSSYSDIASLQTFGFRGEALASLCALSVLTVTTCIAEDVPRGSRLTFEPSGALKDTSVAAAQRGTTVSVESLFHNLPVRRRELDRNIKREWQKVIALLNQYACVQTNLKFSVSHQPTKGRRVLLFSTKGNPSTRENIINIFGAKTMTALVSLDLRMEIRPSTTQPVALAHASTESSLASKELRVVGHVSRPFHGEGRQTPDRQMFFVNGRPCALPQFAKAFNEVYRSYNSSQSPFIFADIRLDTDLYDVNVSPDKRSILLHDQNHLLDNLRTSLTDLFDTYDYSVPVSQPSRITRSLVPEDQGLGEELGATPKSDATSDDDVEDAEAAAASAKRGQKQRRSTTLTQPSSRRNQSIMSMFARQKDGVSQRPASSPSDASDDEPGSPEPHDSGPESPSDEVIESERATALHQSSSPVPELRQQITSPPDLSSHALSDNTSDTTLARPSVFSYSMPRKFGSPDHSFERASPTKPKISIGLDDFDASPSVQDAKACPSALQPLRLDVIKSGHDIAARSGRSKRQARSVNAEELKGSPSSSDEDQRQETFSDVEAEDGKESDDELQEGQEIGEEVQSDLVQTDSSKAGQQSTNMPDTAKDIPRLTTQQSAPRVLSSSRRKDATAHIVQRLSVSEQYVRSLTQGRATEAPARGRAGPDARHIEDLGAADAESKLPLIIAKSDFAQMRIAGQFNLGFIIAVRPANIKTAAGQADGKAKHDELFIIDQHASDEKFNFERLQTSTTIEAQRLVHPKRLQLTALEEEILLENTATVEANGFKVDIDTTGRWPVGSRCLLIALPVCRETTFDLQDLEELISLLGESSSESSRVLRPSKVRKVLAMRACRGSVMIGKVLTRNQMCGLVKHMGELDKPWNCPHGRPTMRHLTRLSAWDEVGWNGDLDRSSVNVWKSYVQEKS